MKNLSKKLLSFALTGVMALNLGLTPALAEGGTYDVTVENVKGGYLVVSYTEGNDLYVLPIGKTVKIPAGTELDIQFEPVDGDGDDYSVNSYGITANGDKLDDYYYETISVSKDLTLSAVTGRVDFTDEETTSTKDRLVFSSGKNTDFEPEDLSDFSAQLYIKSGSGMKKATENIDVSYTSIDAKDRGEADDERNGLFEITGGVLKATEPLEKDQLYKIHTEDYGTIRVKTGYTVRSNIRLIDDEDFDFRVASYYASGDAKVSDKAVNVKLAGSSNTMSTSS